MNRFLQQPALWFFSDYRFALQAYWFKKLLYAFLVLKSLYWLLSFDLLFGENSIVYNKALVIHGLKDLAFCLDATGPGMDLVFIITLLVLSLAGFTIKRFYFVHDIVLWFVIVNLHNKIYPSLTGGDFLLNQLLLFNCFLSADDTVQNSRFSNLKVFLHNLFSVAILIQVCLVYLLSGLAKCNDADWLSGTAVKQLLQVNHFNLFHSGGFAVVPRFLFSVLTYLVVFYQLSFPLLIWIKKIKKPLILFGLLMHAYIAFFMGLFEFGLIMMLVYIYFWPFKKTIS